MVDRAHVEILEIINNIIDEVTDKYDKEMTAIKEDHENLKKWAENESLEIQNMISRHVGDAGHGGSTLKAVRGRG